MVGCPMVTLTPPQVSCAITTSPGALCHRHLPVCPAGFCLLPLGHHSATSMTSTLPELDQPCFFPLESVGD